MQLVRRATGGAQRQVQCFQGWYGRLLAMGSMQFLLDLLYHTEHFFSETNTVVKSSRAAQICAMLHLS